MKLLCVSPRSQNGGSTELPREPSAARQAGADISNWGRDRAAEGGPGLAVVGGEGPFLGELPASFRPVSSALSLCFVTFPVPRGWAGSMGAAEGSVPSPAQQKPCFSAHPQLMSTFCVLQGRLLQTKKSGYFPSSSVKPCPVDARVCAEPGAPAGAMIGWQGNFCSTLGGKRCPNRTFGSPQSIPDGFGSQFLPCSEPMVPPQEPHYQLQFRRTALRYVQWCCQALPY